MTTLTITLVTKDGNIDQDASRAAFDAQLTKFVAERETELSTIGNAVHAVFDAYKGASINMPALANLALQRLNAQPSNFSTLEERTLQYVRDNAGTRESGAMFAIGKGKGGGVKRWADQPTEADAAASTPSA